MKILQVLLLTGLLCILFLNIKAQPDSLCMTKVFVKDASGNNITNAKVKHFGQELVYNKRFKAFELLRIRLFRGTEGNDQIVDGELKIIAKGFETFKEEVKIWCAHQYPRVTLKRKKSKEVTNLEYSKSLYGFVKDKNEAVISKVKVKVTDKSGKVFELKADVSGYYRLDLFPQVYKIEFISEGFETFVIDDLEVNNSAKGIIKKQNINLKSLNPEPCGYEGVCEPDNRNIELIEKSNTKIDTNIVNKPLEKLPKEDYK